MLEYFAVAHPLTLTLSLWEKGGDGVALGHEGRRRFKHHAQFACDSI